MYANTGCRVDTSGNPVDDGHTAAELSASREEVSGNISALKLVSPKELQMHINCSYN